MKATKVMRKLAASYWAMKAMKAMKAMQAMRKPPASTTTHGMAHNSAEARRLCLAGDLGALYRRFGAFLVDISETQPRRFLLLQAGNEIAI